MRRFRFTRLSGAFTRNRVKRQRFHVWGSMEKLFPYREDAPVSPFGKGKMEVAVKVERLAGPFPHPERERARRGIPGSAGPDGRGYFQRGLPQAFR